QMADWQKVQRERPRGIADEITALFAWSPLEKDDFKGMSVPAGGHGIVRVGWKGRKSEGQPLRLRVGVWTQPEGNVRGREIVFLETPTKLVGPLMFTEAKVSVGT